GSNGWGGFPEEIALDKALATPIPDGMEIITASAFLMTYIPTHHTLLDRAALNTSQTLLLLCAASCVGPAAVELCEAMGVRVIAAASSEDKLAVCKEHGADETILYPAGELDRDAQKALTDRIKELTGGQGADVVYDPVGGDYSEAALRATNWEGRFLVVGFASGPIPKIPLNLALLKGCQIVGVFWGAFTGREPKRHQENLKELMGWFGEGKLKPHVSRTYKFEEVAEALNDMAARKVKGKIVLVPTR